MTTINIDLEWIQIALFDMYDIREALSNQVKRKPKSEGSEETIGEIIDDTIEFLETLESMVERGEQV
jgi:hypothetical protein